MSRSVETEKIKRKKRIDPNLKAVDWSVVRQDSKRSLDRYDICAVEENATSNGPADHALCDDGRVVGAVEAKKLTIGLDGVLTQAARYSRGLKGNGFDLPNGHNVPFVYSTNGELIRFHDVRPEVYDRALLAQTSGAVFEHVFQFHRGDGRSIHEEAA